MKNFSTRQLKVGQEIKTILSNFFMRGDVYHPETFKAINITISEVQVTPDLNYADVYFIPLGGKESQDITEILQSIASKLKWQIGKQMNIRTIPNLVFKIDKSFDVAQRIEELTKN